MSSSEKSANTPVDTASLRYPPWIQAPGRGTMTVRFWTEGKVAGGVQYQLPGEAEFRTAWEVSNGQIPRQEFHSVTLTGLPAGGLVNYRIILIDPSDPCRQVLPEGTETVRSFRVPDTSSSQCSFFFTADLQHPREERIQLLTLFLKQAHAEECDFHVLGGDIGSVFNDVEQDVVNLIVPTLAQFGGGSIPLIYLRGNHELRGLQSPLVPRILGTANGTTNAVFRYGTTAFLQLDCWEDKRSDFPGHLYCKYNLDELFYRQQAVFLAKAMQSEEWTTADHRIVLCHGAPYSHYDACLTMAFELKSLIDPYFGGLNPRWKIDLWLTGHTHRYTRSIPRTDEIAAPQCLRTPFFDGRDYTFPVLTVGGPNGTQPWQVTAFRVDVKEDGIAVKSIDDHGRVFESLFYHRDGHCDEFLSLPHHHLPAIRHQIPHPTHGLP